MLADRPTQSTQTMGTDELLRLAQDEGLSPAHSREVGAALADAVMRTGDLYEVPLGDLTTDAYRGFDARVAMMQAKAGLPRP